MTEREAFQIMEQRNALFREYGYLCAACQKPIYEYGTPQIAHCIAQTESNIRKFGKEVIHHKLNLRPVCSLACNDYCNIGFDPCAAEELADKIRDALLKE